MKRPWNGSITSAFFLLKMTNSAMYIIDLKSAMLENWNAINANSLPHVDTCLPLLSTCRRCRRCAVTHENTIFSFHVFVCLFFSLYGNAVIYSTQYNTFHIKTIFFFRSFHVNYSLISYVYVYFRLFIIIIIKCDSFDFCNSFYAWRRYHFYHAII